MGLKVASHCEACEQRHREKLVEGARKLTLQWSWAWFWFAALAFSLVDCRDVRNVLRWWLY